MIERLVRAEVSVANFLWNLSSVRKLLAPSVKMMAVVKANAYGHGAVALAKAAEQLTDMFGVVCLYEARELREAGITKPIMILNYIDGDSLEACVDLNLTLNIMDGELLQKLDAVAAKKRAVVSVHVKVDTGMHRLGLTPELVLPHLLSFERYTNLRLEGLFTHFATSDEADLSFAREQLARFNAVLSELRTNHIRIPVIHAANSAATMRMPEAHFNMVRPGVILYGIMPSSDFAAPFAPKPVLSLKTTIVQIRTIEKGETVGYGQAYAAVRKTRVAALPVGYADGFRRAPKNWGRVLVRGQYAPIIGRVSMDQTSVDVTEIPQAIPGDEVVLIGDQGENRISAEDVGAALGTINYEVTTGLAVRVSRIYV